MILYYGIGSWWNSRQKDYSKEFINEKKAFISASLNKLTEQKIKNRERFREIFWSIKEEDKIYLKSFDRNTRSVKIKAVGTVICTKDSRKETDKGFCISVKWKKVDFNGLTEFQIEDGIRRNTRIYQETNPEVIQIINDLL